ncbi:translocase of the inner membrane [Rhizophlyctis rosea]|uniref:Translocase of the inner membrane n=1 Tax=Rhizophlyctis rosea TaxID=64517 RepID=A0AAD5X4G9_9FUNG|nr:translocase of the inner membrane [Rhizophlyctis rosea]
MSSDHSRDPCPYNIVNDIGVGFCMGSIGGSIWHGFKGYRNSPRGERFVGSLTAIKARAPVLGGNFAVWSGLFNAGDCLIAGVRGKEDAWNPIIAGGATGAILAARNGPRVMAVSAVFGAAILAVMEGVGAMLNRMQSETYKPQAPLLPPEAQAQVQAQQDALASPIAAPTYVPGAPNPSHIQPANDGFLPEPASAAAPAPPPPAPAKTRFFGLSG